MRTTRAAACGLLLLLAAPVAWAEDAWETPTWAPGDQWDYFVTLPHPQGGPHYAYVAKVLVTGIETLEVGNESVEAYRVVELTRNAAPGSTADQWRPGAIRYTSAGMRWYRTSDLAIIQQAPWDLSNLKTLRSAGGLRFDPPCNHFGLPFEVGQNWTVTCAATRVSPKGKVEATEEMQSFARVEGRENVTTPAGAFDAFVVVAGAEGDAEERQWYASEACWRVRAEDAKERRNTTLLAYKCGDRAGGTLSTVDEVIDLDRLGMPEKRWLPGPALPALLAALALALALARRRA